MKKIKWFTMTDVFDSRVMRISLICTILFIVWHATLIQSGIPYINSIWSWITTLIGPILFIASVKMIYRLYVGYPGGELGGGLFGSLSNGFGAVDGEAILLIIAFALFIAILPIVGFLLPIEVFVGISYKSEWWNLLLDVIKESTIKENIFLFVKGLVINFTISFIVWEIVVNLVQAIIQVLKWAWTGEKLINNKP